LIGKDLDLKPDEIDIVIYHGPGCSDGFGAAFCAWLWKKKTGSTREIEFIPRDHGSSPPDVKDKNVLLVDFTFKKSILENMIQVCNKLAIIDHHLTALEDLDSIDSKYKVFDMKHSGAYLSWMYFFPEDKPPLLIEFIEARDIFKEYPYRDEFIFWFNTIEQSFENLEKLLDNDYLMSFVKKDGVEINKAIKPNVDKSVRNACPKFMLINKKYYMVAHVNAPSYKSDIGNKVMKETFPYADFAFVYSIDSSTNFTHVSLRSTDKHMDCTEIARLFKGGGHRNACGFRVEYPVSTIPGLVLNTGQLYGKINNLYYGELQIEEISYTVVYFNSPTLRSKIGKYFLQDKYNIGSDSIQVCRAIDLQDTDNIYIPNRVSIAAVWYFSGSENATIFSIVFDHTVKDESKNSIKDKLNGEFFGDILIVKIQGVVPKL